MAALQETYAVLSQGHSTLLFGVGHDKADPWVLGQAEEEQWKPLVDLLW